MKIGILAVQGAFAEHEQIFTHLDVETFQIRQAKDLSRHYDGLVLPGGESTVIGKLLKDLGIFQELKKSIEDGLPVFGTCAGLLLLAKNIINDERRHLATMDINARRNAYGRQLSSFQTRTPFANLGPVPMTFIRAPYIESAGPQVEILAQINGKIVAARQNNQLVTAFHPELTKDTKVHEYFLSLI